MSYTTIIERAAFMAHKFEPDTALDRFKATCEAIFPAVVEELAQSVAANLNHPWRSIIGSVTDPIIDGDVIPDVDENSVQIIGNYGFVRDGDDGVSLTDVFSASEIRRLNQNPNDWRKIGVYAFAIVKPRIYHTRPSAIIDVCVLDEAAITTAIQADAVPLFPDAEGAYVTALVRKLLAGNTNFDADNLRQLTA